MSRPEERCEEPRLEEHRLPTERVEVLPDVHDRQVERPHRQPAQAEAPPRQQIERPEEDRAREDEPRARNGDEETIRVVEMEHARGLPEARSAQECRHGQEPPLTEERAELI